MTETLGLVPSCLIPELYAPWKDQPGFVAQQVETIVADGFYRSIELSPVQLQEDRLRIRRACEENSVYVATWLTSVLEQQGLDIDTVDESQRQQSVEAVKQLLPAAVECGSKTVALVGGADPGPSLRARGYDSCYKSLVEISAAAADIGVAVMMEPLDRFAQKKRLVGPTPEAVELFARVRAEQPTFGFAFDTAHAALNEEHCTEALQQAGDQLVNLHLSNAVLDPRDPLYGDRHMMPGKPGFLTEARAAEIIAEAARIEARQGQNIRVAIEARALATSGKQDTAKLCLDFLKAAFAQAEKIYVPSERIGA